MTLHMKEHYDYKPHQWMALQTSQFDKEHLLKRISEKFGMAGGRYQNAGLNWTRPEDKTDAESRATSRPSSVPSTARSASLPALRQRKSKVNMSDTTSSLHFDPYRTVYQKEREKAVKLLSEPQPSTLASTQHWVAHANVVHREANGAAHGMYRQKCFLDRTRPKGGVATHLKL
mmetsp:Transcript_6723/g.12215  ORF Transcript_6723/g.12215 Transcript_6723/m.12215 type:complete len:174 (+) Transcript_6723:86-607(+)